MPPDPTNWMTAPSAAGQRLSPHGSPRRRRTPRTAPGTPWIEATGIGGPPAAPATVAPIGRNGRPRNPITMPGHRRGCQPANTGKTYPPEPLSVEEVLRLLDVIPQDTRCGIRDRALIVLLWRTGLRISEALDLKPHDLDMAAKRVTVARGKGGKRRVVAIDDYGLAGVQPWLFERATLDVALDAPLFCTIQLPGRGGHVYPAYVRAKLKQFGQAARITKRVHPHGLRHTIACELIREKLGLIAAQTQLGHESPGTTALYVRGMGVDEHLDQVAARPAPGASS